MKKPNNEDRIAIPKEFHSFSSKNLFEKCIECDKYLLEDGTEYFIEKAVKKYPGFDAFDVIFEYAICADCAHKMRLRMSKESMQRMELFFAENINMQDRIDVIQTNPNNPEAWTDKCMVNGSTKKDLNEFQLYAHCNGKHLTLKHMPYLISGEVIEQIGHLLSAETIDELNDFTNNHFGPPPELEEEFPHKRLVLV